MIKRQIRKLIKNEHGFSLVELAIAMIIVAIMVGLSMKGYQLVKQANLLAETEQINQYKIAVQMYRENHDALPGVRSGNFDENTFWSDLASTKLANIPSNTHVIKPKIGTSFSVKMENGSIVFSLNGLTAPEAHHIDKSIDDGDPTSGDIQLIKGDCASDGVYNYSDQKVCEIRIQV